MPDKKKAWAYRLAERLRTSDYPIGAATSQMIADELDRAVTNGEITSQEYDALLKRGLKQGFMDMLSVGTEMLTAATVPYYAAQAVRYGQYADDVARSIKANNAKLMTALGRSAYTASAATPLAMTATRQPMSESQLNGSVNGNYFDYPNPFPNGYQKMGYIDPLQEDTRIIGKTNGVTSPKTTTSSSSSSTTAKTSSTTVPMKKGETVASMWTRVTGLPWKAAKEMGLSDGSYASNIEILKGLKSGNITKESLLARIEAENAVPYEPAPAPIQIQPAASTVQDRYVLPPDVFGPADMTPPTDRENNMAAYGGFYW